MKKKTFSHIKTVALLCSILMSSIALSANVSTACNESDWQCHGSGYLTGGGVFTHAFYNHVPLTLTPPDQPTINYDLKNTYPNNFSGMRFGFGTGLDTKRPFTFELDYNQNFTKSKTQDGLQIGLATKSLVPVISYAINPKSRLRVSAITGMSVISTYVTTSTKAPHLSFSVTTNSVDIEPFVGGSLAYQINSKYAVRVVEFYNIANYNQNLDGRLITLLMLNYYP